MNQRDIENKNCYEYIDSETEKPNKEIMNAVKVLLKEIGEDPEREGLVRTPKRVARAFSEWFGGYGKKPEDIFNRTFPSEGYDDMCVIRKIKFISHCEHHLAKFSGMCHIGIIYGDRITGLDKFAKLVDIYAKRLQTQEVMTQQIGEAIVKILKPKGVIVVIEAKHDCVGSRETKNDTLEFVTTYRYGLFEENEHIENRFLKYKR